VPQQGNFTVPTTSNPDAYLGATPYLIVSGAARAIAFYKESFGATELVRLADPSGKVMHAELLIGNATIMLADEFPDMGYHSPEKLGGTPVSMLLYVDDVDAFFAKAIVGGAKETIAVAEQFDGDRRGTLTDPFGHVWLLATRREIISPQELQARFAKLMEKGEE
jgi:PhnB protein